jgi:hypothetical protein
MGIDHSTLPMDSEEYWMREFQHEDRDVLLRRLEALEGRVNRLESRLPSEPWGPYPVTCGPDGYSEART